MENGKHKVVIDARMLHNSGIGTYIKNAILPLSETFDVIFIGNPKEIHELLPKAKVIPFYAPIYSITEQLYLPFLVPTCDVFWSPHINIPVLPIRAKKRLVTIHDMYHAAHLHSFSFAKRIFIKAILWALDCFKPLIITVSQFSKNEVIRFTNLTDERIKVIYNGYNKHIFFPAPANATKEDFILYVGNVKPHKNLILLVNALHLIKEKYKTSFKLKIVGKRDGFITSDETILDDIRQLQLEEDIEFLGQISSAELTQSYQKAKVMVFPSKYEGFGLPPLEALACGCRCIVSDIEVFRELFGDAVLYTPTDDPESLANLLLSIYNEPSVGDQLAERAGKLIQRFSWDGSIKQHALILEELIK